MGGLVSYAGPDSLPAGASPRCHDVDFSIGSVRSRKGTRGVYAFAGNDVAQPGTESVSTAWTNPENAISTSAFASASGMDVGSLDVTQFAFNISLPVNGIKVTLNSNCNTSGEITTQLIQGGIAIGTPKAISCPVTSFGGSLDLWDAMPNVNDTTFGVRFTASSEFALASFLLNSVSITLSLATRASNFQYVKSFPSSDGTLKTLAIDASGEWWVEDVTNAPGILEPLLSGLPPNGYAKSVTAFDREYVCFNDLSTGDSIPRQYTGDWIDRITQVGPGAPPVFSPTAVASPSSASTITGFSITSNVVTLMATNTLTAGEVVRISGLSVATYLNGQIFNVLGTGLSSSQFQISFSHADVASTSDAGTVSPQNTYPIAASPFGITQPPPGFAPHPGGIDAILWSSGPGSQSPGNVITFYYSNAAFFGPDQTLVDAFNSGLPLYVYISTAPVGNGTSLVTSVGSSIPPDASGPRYYFTINVPTSNYQYFNGTGGGGEPAIYQITAATLTTIVPAPGIQVGTQVQIAGAGISDWNTIWTITATLNSGAMSINQTSLTAGTATYSYSVVSGANPTAGELVTITNTLNADGTLNVNNAVIGSVSGGSVGTFTVSGFSAVTDFPATSESGQATTAGTKFQFDPGAQTLGTLSNPIFGNSGDGVLTLIGSSQTISPGTYQGVVFFGTRNDAETFPSIPVTFTVPANTTALLASQIPIGPPNVTYRQISITEPGQNGVPGGDFYTIDDPVTYTVNGVTFTSNSFRIPNNTDTSISLSFRTSDLLAARRIDVQGEDLFNQIEIGSPAWDVAYAGRLFYGLTQTRVQNFINLSFDGGYLVLASKYPLGWYVDPVSYGFVQLLVSPIFGNSYYMQNTTDTTQIAAGLITQSAYRDYYGAQIILPNTLYSVRVTARSPSGIQGSLHIDLSTEVNSTDQRYGLFTITDLTTEFEVYEGTLLTQEFTTVPPALLLRVYSNNLPAGGDVEIDSIEIFPTRQPVNNTLLLVSYIDNPEGVDGVSGAVDTNSENTQPCYGAVVMYDLLYLLKDRSMYYTQDSSGDEPAQWTVHEVSNKAGACGVNAYDSGEEWILMANRNGAYLFTGGEPRKVSQEIQKIWDSLNWVAGKSIWVRNDVQARRFYIGVPMPTPNFYLPNAPVNTSPEFPNVVLMCSYEGQSSGSGIADADPIAATFYGDLLAEELRRKWSIQQIPCPYADFITQANGEDNPLLFGNGIENSKIYILDSTNDDGAEIPWRYLTYGFGSDGDVKKQPVLGAGRKRWSYIIATVTGAGKAVVKFFSNRLDSTQQYTVPGGMALTVDDFDRERPLNIPGNRVYVEFSSGGVDSEMDLSQVTMVGGKDTFNSLTGRE